MCEVDPMTFEQIGYLVAMSNSTTVVARAFRMAVGLSPDAVGPGLVVRPETEFDGMEECFKNYGSPLDGR